MNIEDAIRIIKGLDTSNSEENIEAKKMAVKALEKQRQKKIETWNGQASCPRCKKLFGEMNQKSYYVGNAILQILWAGSGLE